MAVTTDQDARTSSPAARHRSDGGRLVVAVAVGLASRAADRLVPVHPTDAAMAEHPAFEGCRLAHTGSGGAGCGYHLLAFRR